MTKSLQSAEYLASGFANFLQDNSRISLKSKCGATWPVQSHNGKNITYRIENWTLDMEFVDGEKYMLTLRNGRADISIEKYVKYDRRGKGNTPLWGNIFENNLIELRRLTNSK